MVTKELLEACNNEEGGPSIFLAFSLFSVTHITCILKQGAGEVCCFIVV